ncbi:hypothetical protein, partial [Hallella bergensis]|uniref:hypothetical protein n=1 Tax=Hallella bergensis TaxID=242750 RepID=UPI0023F0BD38
LSELKILAETWRFLRWMIQKNRPENGQESLQTGRHHAKSYGALKNKQEILSNSLCVLFSAQASA